MNIVELAFEEYGDPNDPPLIILHGFLASSRNWRTVATRLAKNHRVFVLDMRNHGASPHHQHMDYPIMAQDVIRFMDKMRLDKAHLLGHSMGGKVAMCVALSHPERIRQLMIADIAPVSYDHSFDPMIDALKQLPLDQLNNRKEAEQLLAAAVPDLSFRQFLLQNLILKDGAYGWRIDLEIIEKTAHHIVGFPADHNEVFADRALFIAGEHSDYIQPDAVFEFFPNAEIVEIPDTGHWLYVQAPDRFCRIIEDWIVSI